MNEIAEATSIALPLTMQAAFGLTKICDQTKLCLDCLIVIEPSLHSFEACASLLFCGVFNVYISNHVISNVVYHNDV